MANPTVISNSLLSILIAEVILVILFNLRRAKMVPLFPTADDSSRARTYPVSLIGSAIPLLLAIAMLSPTTLMVVEGLSAVAPPPKNNVIAITHAAGRMGKLLALQLREDAALRYQQSRAGISLEENDDEDDEDDREAYLPKIRAIVRSEQEAYAVQCDLGGMKMVAGGKAQPITLDWLETIVVDSNELDYKERSEKLRASLEGCRAAILCDASHNELVWTEECDVETTTDAESCGFQMIVPALESMDLSKRLLEEIDATSYSSTLEHVVLRSTMGLAVSQAAEAHRLYLQQKPSVPLEPEIDWEALATAMGGEAALAGPRIAEAALKRAASAFPDRKHTILRLGALTDDPGMVPLVFGRKDSILVKTTDDGTQNYRPPILSRSDAARISTVLVRSGDDEDGEEERRSGNSKNLVAVDCAWHPTYGRDSVGREETVSAAARQNLNIRDILDAIPDEAQSKQQEAVSQS